MTDADIGLIGLAVMGQNLALNIHDHGFKIAVYNRTTSKVDDFLSGSAKGSEIIGTRSIEEFVAQLKSPRRIIMMVKAGHPVDALIEQLLPHLDEGDILMDGGNALYTDTQRRTDSLSEKNILFLGTGISGGEEGARTGPSIMPGGNKAAWSHVQSILQSISAKVDNQPCCDWVGDGGAGHYVKMVHNGIEYGDMQIICEAYQLMREGLNMAVDEIADVFSTWNEGILDSYLIEITANILKVKDEDGLPLVDKILDTAGQKGTGKWTAINALELGMPLTLISEAVSSRFLSSIKQQRISASTVLKGSGVKFEGDRETAIKHIQDALYCSKIVSYAQGYMLMQAAAEHFGWKLNYGGIALMWRGGCIIRSQCLANIREAFENNPDLDNLLLDDFFKQAIDHSQNGWRQSCVLGINLGIPLPALNSALNFYDGYRQETLPANLLQAQRDYFGAHTYERVDKPRGEFFHTEWIGD
jgi:6-phosphogluconate dehydrogenase